MSKFSKQQQQRFQKDLQAINLDSDSELEDSFYGKQMARLQSELNQLKTNKKEDPILAIMRQNIQNENKMIAEYEEEVTQLRRITHNEQKNVIDQSVLEEIKNRVAIKANQSVLHLADQQYNLSVVRQSLIQQKQMEGSKLFGKKKGFLQEIEKQQQLLKKRLDSANAEREHLAMQQQDKLSMKYEMDYLSKLFSQRFIQPKLRKLQQKDCKVKIVSTSIKGTFTNLVPQIVNQANILPKNSPEIALKLLRNNKRKSLKSISETNVKLHPKIIQNNPQAFQQVESQTNPAQKGLLIQNLQHHFVSYITYISGFLGSLSQISKNYSPKFLKFLEQKQKNINYQFNDSQVTGKQKSLSQVASIQNSKQLKQIKLTLESITNVSGLEHFINIQEAQLQFNSINMLKPIQSCKKLIQINLSYNKLKNISSISHLPWLRLLNIEHNLVGELKLPCKSLQIVWGGHNLIEDIDLNESKYLRVLILNNNKLNELPRLKLHNLQELNLNRNQLRSLKNLQELILLKKLSLSSNRFQTIDEKLTFLYLNQLNLSHNYIKKLNIFFLPCLERLYLNNNKIAQRTNVQLYLPNLKQLNLDENKLEGFSPIWQLLLHSRKLQYLRYSNNEYFLNLREKTREVFEYFIYKHMDNAKIINENQMDIGIKKYYQSNYDIYYHGIKFFKENSMLIKSIENNINFILQQFNFAGDLQKNKKSFIREKQYIYYQSVRKIKQLEQIVSFVKQYSNKGNHIITIDSSLFYHFDQFQTKKRNLYHSIRTLVVKKRYRRRQRLNYFIKNKPKICQILKILTQLHNFSQKKKSVFKFKHLLRGLTQNQAAIKIQKIWRGYIRRKLYKKLKELKNHKPESDSDFEDVDTDFFNQELQHHEFDIRDIEGLDFQELIIRPDVFQYIQNKQKNQKGQKIKEGQKQAALTAQEKRLMVNNFLDSRTKLKNNDKKPQQEKQIAVQWGITDPRLMKTLLYKQQKKAQVRRKEEEKNMTAAERLQKFRRGGR